MIEDGDPAQLWWQSKDGVGRDFLATCYEVFLGRQLDDRGVADERGRWPLDEALPSVTNSDEFVVNVYRKLWHRAPLSTHREWPVPTMRHTIWAADTLPLRGETRDAILRADNWQALLTALLLDPIFAGIARLPLLPSQGGALGRQPLVTSLANADMPLAVLEDAPDIIAAIERWRARIDEIDHHDRERAHQT